MTTKQRCAIINGGAWRWEKTLIGRSVGDEHCRWAIGNVGMGNDCAEVRKYFTDVGHWRTDASANLSVNEGVGRRKARR